MSKGHEAIAWNQSLNKLILETGRLDAELFEKLQQACNYNSSTSVSWAISKLDLFRTLIEDQKPIWVFEPEMNSLLKIEKPDQFAIWRSKHFGNW